MFEGKGLTEVIAGLKKLQGRLKVDQAKAINDIAKQAQRKMVSHTFESVTVRGKWPTPGTRFGYNLDKATPGKLEARVFTRAPWAVEQEMALAHRAKSGKHVIVPMEPVRAGRTDPKKIPGRLKPAAMGAKLFPIVTRHGIVLATRMKRAGLRILWALESVVHYPKRLNVREAGIREANKVMTETMNKTIDASIRDAGLK
jgi:hypothetical protein